MPIPELIQQADALKAELDQLRPLDETQESRIWQQFRLWWNYHSNSIEGNSLTYGETRLLILHGLTANGKPLRHHFEVVGHNEALKWLLDVVKGDYPLTEQFIRELHQMILKERYLKKVITPDGQEATAWVEVGQYKNKPNHVLKSTGEIFFFASPEETPARMEELINWYQERQEKNDLHPILQAVEMHYRFIRIHPFDDGNGRVARLLLNFILLRHGYPPVIIRKEDKEDYLLALEQADAGQLEAFSRFIAQNLIQSLRIMLRGARGEDITEEDDWEKRIELLQQSLEEEDAPTVEKTNELLWQRFQDSFLPLFELLEQKMRRFDGFYANHKHGPKYATLEAITGKEEKETFEAFIRRANEQENLPVFQELGYRFHWEGLKNSGTQLFELAFSVRINLEHRFKYSVSVAFPEIPDMEKLYSQTISEEERRNLVRQVGDKLVEIVENQVKKAKEEG